MPEHDCTEEARIKRNQGDIQEMVKDHKADKSELWAAIDSLKTAMNYRLPLWATFLIAFLSSACTGLIVRSFS